MSTQNFRTPEEFIEYYSHKLEEYLEIYNLQINKTGFIGFLLSLLGWTNYDIKLYYDNLFKEMFVATAQEDSSLLLHGSLYGYIPLFATPALAEGKFHIDWTLLPPGDLDKQIIFNYQTFPDPSIQGGNYLTIYIDDLPFTSYSQYVIKEVATGTTSEKIVEITSEDGSVQIVPISGSNINVEFPLVSFKQYYVKLIEKTLDNYPLYTYSSVVIELDSNEFIYDIIVNVKEPGSGNYETFEIQSIKYFSQANDKHAFLRQISPTKYLLEFGNGVHGKWVPNAEIAVVLKITKGGVGNGLLNKETKKISLNQVTYYHTLPNANHPGSTPVSLNINFEDLGKIVIDSTSNGRDPLSGDDLRYAIVKHIQSRDVLISEHDFYNIASKYFTDFKFLFKKSMLQEHTFYLLRAFRDKYQNVIKTTQADEDQSTFGATQFEPTFTINGETYISPFLYVFNSDLNLYESKVVFDNYTAHFSEQKTLITDISNPSSVYLQIIYDHNTEKTTLYFRSYQDITNHVVKISSEKFDWNSNTMTEDAANNRYYIEYDGLIDDYFDVQIDFFDSSGSNLLMIFKARNLRYCYGMEGFVDLVVYQNKVINIPVIDYSVYTANSPSSEIEYKQKIVDFIIGNKLPEVRAVCDNIQFRFLNTISIKNPYLFFISKQGKSIVGAYDTFTAITYQPPTSPNEGDLYYILPGAVGAFYGHDNDIAEYKNGEFIFHESKTTFYEDVIEIRNDPPTGTISTGSRYIIGPSPTGAWSGHEHEIAEWDGTDWQYTIPQLPSVCKVTNEDKVYRYYKRWNGSSYDEGWTSDIQLILPLTFKCYVVYDQNLVSDQRINVSDDVEKLKVELAELLIKKYSGASIKYYNSQIIDYIHNSRPYIKSININVFDKLGRPIPFGIESVEYNSDFLSNFTKYQVATFTPPLWYWDIDNIDVRFSLR